MNWQRVQRDQCALMTWPAGTHDEMRVGTANRTTHDLAIAPDWISATALALAIASGLALGMAFSSVVNTIVLIIGHLCQKGESIFALTFTFAFALAPDNSSGTACWLLHMLPPLGFGALVFPEKMFIKLVRAKTFKTSVISVSVIRSCITVGGNVACIDLVTGNWRRTSGHSSRLLWQCLWPRICT